MTAQVSTGSTGPNLNRVYELACMNRALWAAVAGDKLSGLGEEQLDWLTYLGCELMTQLLDQVAPVGSKTQAPWEKAP